MKPSQGIKIAFLGDTRSVQCWNLTKIFTNLGWNLQTLDYSLSAYLYGDSSHDGSGRRTGLAVLNRAKRFSSQLFGLIEADQRNRLLLQLDQHETNCILAYWGTNPFADIITIKKYRPHIRIILDVLCHPMGLTPGKITLQNHYLRYAVRYVDAIIFSSREMERYFHDHIIQRNHIRSIIRPFYYCSDLFPQTRLPKILEKPNLIFMGRMDWWAGQPTDNIVSHIEAIMDQGVHVFHSDKTDALPYHPYRHVFRPKSLADVIDFATQFDAALLYYNLDGCQKDDRFRLTIPDRLFAATAAGIPVAIPSHGYDACKEFLQRYKATIEYGTPSDLATKLSKTCEMAELVHMAAANSEAYKAEAHSDQFISFIEDVCATTIPEANNSSLRESLTADL